jgi:YidC/Oxa1 family membrane protein insertase
MDEQNRNLLLAFALSLMVIVVWFALFPPPEPQPAPSVAQSELLPPPSATAPATTAAGGILQAEPTVTGTVRIEIDTPRVMGSISLTGGRIDDLQLRDYFETTQPGSDIVHLFNPVGGGRDVFYALYGWSPGGTLDFDAVPGPNTEWTQRGTGALTVDSPVTLEWDNGAGLIFARTIAVDANFMFTVTQSVENRGEGAVTLSPYGILAQHGLPSDLESFFISHEGMVQMTDGRLLEDNYKAMRGYRVSDRERTPAQVTEAVSNGWVGLTGKYFMATLAGMPGQPVTTVSQYVPGADIYQVSIRHAAIQLAPGESGQVDSMLFAGRQGMGADLAHI